MPAAAPVSKKKSPSLPVISITYKPKLLTKSEWLEARQKLSQAKTSDRYRHWAITIGNELRFLTHWDYANELQRRNLLRIVEGLWDDVRDTGTVDPEYELAVVLAAIQRVNYKGTKIVITKIKRSLHPQLSSLAADLLEMQTTLIGELQKAERFMTDFLQDVSDFADEFLDELDQKTQQ